MVFKQHNPAKLIYVCQPACGKQARRKINL